MHMGCIKSRKFVAYCGQAPQCKPQKKILDQEQLDELANRNNAGARMGIRTERRKCRGEACLDNIREIDRGKRIRGSRRFFEACINPLQEGEFKKCHY